MPAKPSRLLAGRLDANYETSGPTLCHAQPRAAVVTLVAAQLQAASEHLKTPTLCALAGHTACTAIRLPRVGCDTASSVAGSKACCTLSVRGGV